MSWWLQAPELMHIQGKNMHIAFRADASLQIGTGHVMRCLTLANTLRERGAQCSFICRPHQGHLLELIAQHGHQALALLAPTGSTSLKLNDAVYADWLGTDWARDAHETQEALKSQQNRSPVDWLVVDHYAIDARWEEAIRPKVKRIMVIDDLADRPHACDMLLDQNLGRQKKDYDGLLKTEALTLIGPQYALLRPEFAALRSQSIARRQRNPQLSRLLITFGGVDKDNATGQVLLALKDCILPDDLHITVVLGPFAPWLLHVQAQAAQMPRHTEVLVGINNMAQIMAESDLAIGAAGSTAWERCSLGLPSVLLVQAPNQLAGALALQNIGAAVTLESQKQIADFMNETHSAEFTKNVLSKLSNAAAGVTSGHGCIRAAAYMKEHIYA